MSSKNSNLHKAKSGKNDEFYTQLKDIENELKHYKDHFKDKVVYCNCDDPEVSNFFKYFSLNFKHLGLKKLIASCYKNVDPEQRTSQLSKKAVWLEYSGEHGESTIPTHENITVHEFAGDGDFRSDESIELLKQADIVVTNPPFSLFREYVEQLMEYDKKFIILGNLNALTYKEVFPLIKENRVWMGYKNGAMSFQLADDAELKSSAYVDDNGDKIQKFGNIAWYTNLEIAKRYEDIILFREYTPKDYPKYDNYDAINVDKVKDIPVDYDGVMGVPITFVDKYNPEQFEIVGLTTGRKEFDNAAHPTKKYINAIQINKDTTTTNGSKMNTRATLFIDGEPSGTHYIADNAINPLKIVYARILIRHKKKATE